MTDLESDMRDLESAMRDLVRGANRRTALASDMFFGLDFFIRYYRSVTGETLTPQMAHEKLMANPLVTCYPAGGYWMWLWPMSEGANTQIEFAE